QVIVLRMFHQAGEPISIKSGYSWTTKLIWPGALYLSATSISVGIESEVVVFTIGFPATKEVWFIPDFIHHVINALFYRVVMNRSAHDILPVFPLFRFTSDSTVFRDRNWHIRQRNVCFGNGGQNTVYNGVQLSKVV